MDESNIERLINQCRSNDVDHKIDAVTKLQAEFEAGSEISDTDALITVLKACLRTPNQHLTNATLSALPPLLPRLITRAPHNASQPTSPAASTSSIAASSSLIDAHILRQVLMAFLPPGGVIDRLGDSRDKAREKARETLVILGGFAFHSGGSALGRSRDGKGPETPLMIFERFLKEVGLGSKVWRVREQAILTLAQIRRTHHQFPIRPYLPQLVESLEDTDGTVREMARQSVVELFTGPAITDAARADLKKEMIKKGVRKTIVDNVLSKVLAAGSSSAPASDAGSENGDVPSTAGAGYVPPSLALMNKRPGPSTTGSHKPVSHGSVRELSRPASRAAVASPVPTDSGNTGSDVKAVYIASARDLENEFASMLKHFEGKETEHNWAAREKAILRVRGMLKGDVHERYLDVFLHGLKHGFIDASVKTLLSLRTTVASHTCSLYSELAIALGTTLDSLTEPLYLNLSKMASLTKKIVAQQSQATITTIISHTSPQPRILLPLLWNMLQDKSVQARQYVMGHVKTFLEVNASRAKHSIEATGGLELLEKSIKKALGDPNPGVRDIARQCFWLFESVWKDHARVIMDALDTTSKRQLEKACPDPERLTEVVQAPTTPKSKKSSVAAAIAASRAKAKAIATAPPSLRHQATSTARTTSPPTSKRPASPSFSSTSSTGARATSPISRLASSSSSPPRTRVISGGTLSRSTSAGFVPSSHSRETSRSTASTSPPSPPADATFRRRTSSPLVQTPPPATTTSAFRRALQTALPASPPPSFNNLPVTPTPRPQFQRQVAPLPRDSLSIMQLRGSEQDVSLLIASQIPIPEDETDSEMDMDVDESINLISFSTPYEMYPPKSRSAASFSPKSSSSKPAHSNPLSSVTGTSSPPTGLPQPMVEDAMRARAEQAESAAQRLLELVEPEDEGLPAPSLPPSLLLSGAEATPKLKPKPTTPEQTYSAFTSTTAAPQTPVSKSAAILRKAALFQDSPARNGSSTSVFDMIDSRRIQSEWWTKRTSLINQVLSPEVPSTGRREELNEYIQQLEQGSADIAMLKRLVLFCRQNPVNEPLSPISPALSDPLSPTPLFKASSHPSLKSDLWTQDKTFDRLFDALVNYLNPNRGTDELEYGLIVLWEMLECQAPYLESREASLFSLLLHIRYCGHINVMQATAYFRDALVARIDPVYGLTTMHASIKAFRNAPTLNTELRDGTFAFGLTALGKFMLRLPSEVLEDELPRLRDTLISALTDPTSIVIREAAAAAIIAAQLIIQDETHVFTLLDGLPEDKKNLLAYLFDKHSSRGSALGVPQSGIERLEKEIRRLDNRTSTPPRPHA
ncbi:hypothetical protein K474DRAFT_1657611 [Panus rudis PR-1116 ss-1]|nr:hypothetical protein K474DRAFT_1657611 [Panus rudis PR-1116 ss-1]